MLQGLQKAELQKNKKKTIHSLIDGIHVYTNIFNTEIHENAIKTYTNTSKLDDAVLIE